MELTTKLLAQHIVQMLLLYNTDQLTSTSSVGSWLDTDGQLPGPGDLITNKVKHSKSCVKHLLM